MICWAVRTVFLKAPGRSKALFLLRNLGTSAVLVAVGMASWASAQLSGPDFVSTKTEGGYRVEFELGNYHILETQLGGRQFSHIQVAGQPARLKRQGLPELPVYRVDLRIPPGAAVEVENVLSLDEDVICPVPLLSPGFVRRDKEGLRPGRPLIPSAELGRLFPDQICRLTTPFHIRHHRGVGLIVHPFRYLAEPGILRVAKRITVSLRVAAPESTRAATGDTAPARDFEALARHRFINQDEFETGAGGEPRSAAGVNDSESLLLVVPAGWASGIESFLRWKRQRGIRVQLAIFGGPELNSSSELEDFIQQVYDDTGVSQIILLADEDFIPPRQRGETPSDTLYALLEGDDQYHDAFISRVTANSRAEMEYQLSKFVDYEKNPSTAEFSDWYRTAVFVGSDEGAEFSAFEKDDWEILEEEIPTFRSYGYDPNYRAYDPGATQSDVIEPWNAGCSYILYLGHGTYTTWITCDLDVPAVSSLVNGPRLPFVLNANCENGYFTMDGRCLAEAMMAAGSFTEPAGAVGVMAASSTADWDPPIVLTRRFNDLLLSGTNLSLGALAFRSVQAGMDYCATTPGQGISALRRLMQQSHLFGDSTLGLRTKSPVAVEVEHPPAAVSPAPFAVAVKKASGNPIGDAAVCLYHEPTQTQITGRTNGNGLCTLDLAGLALRTRGETLTLTVYANNLIPYQVDLPLVPDGIVISSPVDLTPAIVDEPYQFTNTVLGGVPPYDWTAPAGLPFGLELDGLTGLLSGTLTIPGTYQFDLAVEDSDGRSHTQTLNLRAGHPVKILDTDLPQGTVASPYSASPDMSGTFQPITVTLDSGTLPPGINLSDDGGLSGTPSVRGTYMFDLRVKDAAGFEDVERFSISIIPSEWVQIETPERLDLFMPGHPASLQLSAAGGTGEGYEWTLVSGALPPELQLSQSGLLSGTPDAAGWHEATIMVSDNDSPARTAQKTFIFEVHEPARIGDTALPDATEGVPYHARIDISGTLNPLIVAAREGFATYVQTTDTSPFDWSAPGNPDLTTEDGEMNIVLPYQFTFFGESYGEVTVGQNGYIAFGGDSPPGNDDPSITKLQNRKMIAPLWTDVYFPFWDNGGVYIERSAMLTTIRWVGEGLSGFSSSIDVALDLHIDGRIVMHYNDARVLDEAIVGISGGTQASTQVLLNHPQGQGYLEGWSGRSSIVFTGVPAVPDWLEVHEDGTLQGTPPMAGTYAISVALTDGTTVFSTTDLELSVLEPEPVDTDGDGNVSDAELLDAIDRFERDLLPRTLLDEAIVSWQNPVPRRGPPLSGPDPCPPPKARTGSILVVEAGGLQPAMLQALIQGRYDIADRQGDSALIYCTQNEYEQLEALGLALKVVDQQFVPEDGRGEGTVRVAGYPSYQDMADELADRAGAYPGLCRTASIGTSRNGREIRAVKLSDNVATDEPEPEVYIVSTMHGDEKAGTVLCLRLIELLLDTYGTQSGYGPRSTALIDSTEIWVVPILNPDGYENHTRYNANGVDLNRSFPDGAITDLGSPFPIRDFDTAGLEPETAAFIEWSLERNFALGASLHTGALLIAYPYGNNASGSSVYTAAPDDETFVAIASSWRDLNPAMTQIINAAEWYAVQGELADWGYRFLGTPGITPELSNVKTPPAAELEGLWDDNREAMLSFLEVPVPILKGRVTDALTGETVYAEIRIESIDRPVYTHPATGDYSRLLLEGTYAVEASAPGYLTARFDEWVIDNGQAILDVELTPVETGHVVRRLPATGYTAGREAHVRLDIDVSTARQGGAYILSEKIPAGFELVGAEILGGGTETGPMRQDNETVSWLLWGDSFPAQPTSLILRWQPETRTGGQVELSGGLVSLDGREEAAGPRQWGEADLEDLVYALDQGWNALSCPLVPVNADFAALFPAGAQPTAAWTWEAGTFRPTGSLTTGTGCWVLCREPVSITVQGTPETRVVSSLPAGWQFKGTYGQLPADALPDSLELFLWDPQSMSYQTPTLLRPGDATWIKLEAPLRIDLRHGR